MVPTPDSALVVMSLILLLYLSRGSCCHRAEIWFWIFNAYTYYHTLRVHGMYRNGYNLTQCSLMLSSEYNVKGCQTKYTCKLHLHGEGKLVDLAKHAEEPLTC